MPCATMAGLLCQTGSPPIGRSAGDVTNASRAYRGGHPGATLYRGPGGKRLANRPIRVSSSPTRRKALPSCPALGGPPLGALILVDVEDQVVGGGVADVEVKGGARLQLAEQLDRLLEAHRERRPALGEALDRDLGGGADLARRVLEADQLGEVPERADLDPDQALEEALRLGSSR